MVRILSAAAPRCVEEAASVLRRGGLIIYPTDTVYGLGALASDDEAVRRLFQAKGRPPEKSFPLLLAEAADVERVAAIVPAARILMERFWPGALTIVLPKSPRFHSPALTGATVAVRVPDHTLLREIIRRAGGPITGTSANRSGLANSLTVEEALQQLDEAVDLAIDAGPCRIATESTIVDLERQPPRILREGAVSKEAIEDALGMLLLVAAEGQIGR